MRPVFYQRYNEETCTETKEKHNTHQRYNTIPIDTEAKTSKLNIFNAAPQVTQHTEFINE